MDVMGSGSDIRKRRKPRTATIEVAMDIRDLAFLLKCYDTVGYNPTSRADALSKAFDLYIDLLVTQFPDVDMPESTEQAKQVVESVFGKGSFARGGRGMMNMKKRLEYEDRNTDARTPDVAPVIKPRQDVVTASEAIAEIEKNFSLGNITAEIRDRLIAQAIDDAPTDELTQEQLEQRVAQSDARIRSGMASGSPRIAPKEGGEHDEQ